MTKHAESSSSENDSQEETSVDGGIRRRFDFRCTADQLLAGSVMMLAFVMGCSAMQCPEIWTHIRTGQLIMERGSVPYSDWYTFTVTNGMWLDQEWLFDLIAASLYALGGVKLLVAAKALCQAITVRICWSAAGDKLPVWMKAAFSVPLIICLSWRAVARPEMLSHIFLATWLLILSRADRKPALLWILPGLMVVWTNLHGLFALGMFTGAAFVVHRMVHHFVGGRWGLAPAARTAQWKYVPVIGAATVFASLINPYFEEGALFPFLLYTKLLDDPAHEHDPLSAVYQVLGFRLFMQAQLTLWIAAAASFVWLFRKKYVSVLRLLMFVAFTHLAWVAIRNIGIYAIVTFIIVCQNLSDMRMLKATESQVRGDAHAGWANGRATSACVAIVAALIICVVTDFWNPSGRRFGLKAKPGMYSHEAARFAGEPGMPDRALLFEFSAASVYIFHNAPERYVYMDGRLEIYDPDMFDRYLELVSSITAHDGRWMRSLRDREGNLPAVIIEKQFPELICHLWTTPGWRLVFSDEMAGVFIQETLADQLHLPEADLASLLPAEAVEILMRVRNDESESPGPQELQ